ncbi:MAG TPA: hypothetical protein VEB63_09265 [Chitinophagaceae bacterium]|nr:hypothetical protein [Chitinophagaceae bacterium]
MFLQFRKLIAGDQKLQWILAAGLIVQLATSVTAIGFSTFDQHFSIIEFSSYQLGEEHAADYAVELREQLRPTAQVYLFSTFRQFCGALGIDDPYAQLTILRILLGAIMFAAFNLAALYFFHRGHRRVLYWVLLILNFSWMFPYTRTLYSSEMMAGLFFLVALALYDAESRNRSRFGMILFVGFLFALGFYFRYQIALALIGVGIWILFAEKKHPNLGPLALGFAAGLLLNFYLDSRFYEQWVFTPFEHFHHNIVKGKSSDYGHQSFLRYVGTLSAVITAPPFSLVLFGIILIGWFRNPLHPIFLGVALFVIGHSLVGHKEERFLYPVFPALPLLAGWSIPYLLPAFRSRVRPVLKVLLILTVVVNVALLGAFMLVPYSQTVHFGNKLRKKFNESGQTVYCLYRSPYETMSGVPMRFYQKGVQGFTLRELTISDSIAKLPNGAYFATTFNEIKTQFSLLDSLGFRPVAYSSSILWKLNGMLHSRGKPTVNDSWVLFRKDQ